MTVRAMIADDERRLAAYLEERLADLWPELEICGKAANGVDALAMIDREKPDIAFLDIKMPGLTGLEVARKMTHSCIVVFVTAFQQYAVDAFEEEAVDYLLKPINDERLSQTISRVKKRLEKPASIPELAMLLEKLSRPVERKPSFARYLRASKGKEWSLIPVGKVLYIKSDQKYTIVRTREAEFLMRTPLSELLTQIDPERFWQIHRSTIVNASKVQSVTQAGKDRYVLRLCECDTLLAVSREFIHRFR